MSTVAAGRRTTDAGRLGWLRSWLDPHLDLSTRIEPAWWRTARLATVAILLVCSAFPAPTRDVHIPVPGSLFNLAIALTAVVTVLDLRIRGFVWPTRAMGYLGIGSIVIGAASVLWSLSRGSTIVYTASVTQSLIAAWGVIALTRGLTGQSLARIAAGWVWLLIVPCALLWARVIPPPSTVDPTDPDWAAYFARFSHPYIGPSNNPGTLWVIFVLPLAIYAVRRRDLFVGLGALAALTADAMTMSRGVGAALVAAMIGYVVLRFRESLRLVAWVPLGLAVSAAAIFLMVTFNSATAHSITSRTSLNNLESRDDLATSSTTAAIESSHWILGSGGDASAHVHNTALQQFLFFGAVLGVIMVVLMAGVVVQWFTRRDAVSWMYAAAGAGFAAQLAACLIQASYEGNLLRPLMWVTWGLVAAIALATRAEETGEAIGGPVAPGSAA